MNNLGFVLGALFFIVHAWAVKNGRLDVVLAEAPLIFITIAAITPWFIEDERKQYMQTLANIQESKERYAGCREMQVYLRRLEAKPFVLRIADAFAPQQ